MERERRTIYNAKEAQEYIKEHKIDELFQNMLSQLIFYRPDNPVEFMLQHIDMLIKNRDEKGDLKTFWKENDLKSVIRALDTTLSGYITVEQCKNTLDAFNINEHEDVMTLSQNGMIPVDVLEKKLKSGILKVSKTYKQEN